MQKSCRRTKVYIYPPFASTNAYIKNMVSSFDDSKNHEIVRHCLQTKPLWNLYLNTDADVCIINWVEGMCLTKKGFLKFLYATGFMLILRSLGKKVVWIFHNKHPHEKNTAMTRMGMKWLATISSFVITHSLEGIKYFEKQYQKKKCYYIPHPVYSTELKSNMKTEWDYVVWGEISERKCIREFLEYVRGERFFDDKRILICGRCKNKQLAETLERLSGGNVTFINRFIPDEELDSYICRSRIIVFTYNESSTLSSGALIYSLNYNKPIIGPNVGAFHDLEGIVTTYAKFEDIPSLNNIENKEMIQKYIQENQWKDFPRKIDSILRNE